MDLSRSSCENIKIRLWSRDVTGYEVHICAPHLPTSSPPPPHLLPTSSPPRPQAAGERTGCFGPPSSCRSGAGGARAGVAVGTVATGAFTCGASGDGARNKLFFSKLAFVMYDWPYISATSTLKGLLVSINVGSSPFHQNHKNHNCHTTTARPKPATSTTTSATSRW